MRVKTAERAVGSSMTSPHEASRHDPTVELSCGEQMATAAPGIAATYWFEVDTPTTEAVTVRFTGRRIGGHPSTAAGDRFERTVTVEGSQLIGHASLTARVHDITAGQWTVTARPLTAAGRPHPRWPASTSTQSTRLATTAYGPGVRWAAWPILVGTGAIAAIAVQAALFARVDTRWWLAALLTLAACVVGFPCAKVYYLILHRGGERSHTFASAGSCIQGFLLGAVTTMVGVAALLGLPVGALLDATTPGLFIGIAVGRPGCVLAGCCAGRPTPSRWSIWSSDRRVGVRRFPVPLFEAGFAVTAAAATLIALLTDMTDKSGSLFVAAAASYVLFRQLLFPLRGDPHTGRGRLWTTIAAAIVLGSAVAVWIL